MNTTTPAFGPDFVSQLIPFFLNAFQEAVVKAYLMLWGILITFLKTHWLGVSEILLGLLGLALLVFLVTGRWAMLGSILNRYFFFGSLFIIGLIFGPAVFARDYFEIVWVVLGLIVFAIVGKIFKKKYI